MTEKIHARIPLRFVGVAPVVKDAGGVVVKQFDHVDVEALASALVPDITVDLSALIGLESAICIRDLVVPAGIELQHEPDEIVASVSEATEEAAALTAASTPEAVEVVGTKGKEKAVGAAEGSEAKTEQPAGREKKKEKK